jgi:hypothetical protein
MTGTPMRRADEVTPKSLSLETDLKAASHRALSANHHFALRKDLIMSNYEDHTTLSTWLTKVQASHELRCSPSTVRQLVQVGKLRAVKTALDLLICPDDLSRLKKEREQCQAERAR